MKRETQANVGMSETTDTKSVMPFLQLLRSLVSTTIVDANHSRYRTMDSESPHIILSFTKTISPLMMKKSRFDMPM